MLSPSALERATPGYRSGYSDAVRGMPNDPTHGNAHPISVWWKQDYEEGYRAALNDMKPR